MPVKHSVAEGVSLLVGHDHKLGAVLVGYNFEDGSSFKIQLPPYAAKELIVQIQASIKAIKDGPK